MNIEGKDIVVMFAVSCVTALGIVYVALGGDSVAIATITGMVGTVVGYYFGIRGKET